MFQLFPCGLLGNYARIQCMSYSSRGPKTLSATAEIPRGEAIARYTSYADAQKAVDYLADQQFEVAKVSIIGSDLKSVEQVTGAVPRWNSGSGRCGSEPTPALGGWGAVRGRGR